MVSRVSGEASDAIDVLTLLHTRRFKGDILLVGADYTMERVQNCGRQFSLAMLAPLGTPYRAVELHERLYKFLQSRPTRRPRGAAANPVQVADALRQQRFDIYYQSKVDTRRLAICGTEVALALRPTTEPTGGRLFRPTQDDQADLAELSAFALSRSVQDVSACVDDLGRAELTLNVPVFGQPDRRLVELADALMADHSAMPRLLFQIRARDLLAHASEFASVLGTIRRSTIGVSLDDVDVGQLPRGVFEDIPIVELKVNRSSLPEHDGDRRKHGRCSRILELARRHNLRTVATGVDASAGFSQARDAGFDMVQGPLFGVPVPRDKLARVLLPRQSGAA